MDTTTTLCCPECGNDEFFGTRETVLGTAWFTVYADGTSEYDGETQVHWDTQETVRDEQGRLTIYCCECHHEFPSPEGFEVGG